MENGATWIGVAALAISALFAWLNKRDQLRHDAEIITLKQQSQDHEKRSKECEEKHEQTAGKLEACEEKHQTTELQISEIKHQIAQLKKD